MIKKHFQTEIPLNRWWPLFILLIVSGAAAILASLQSGDTALPWWYAALLRFKIPAWLMPLLERPWFITGAMAIFFLSKLAVVGFLTAQLIITRRRLTRLIEEYEQLHNEHLKLQKSINKIQRATQKIGEEHLDDTTGHTS